MIRVEHFSHTYSRHEVVHNLDLMMEAHDIYGFIGPNGAGKTTTIRFLATLLKPTRGQATIYGLNVVEDRQEVRKIIGFMPDHFGIYPKMTVLQFLDFFGLAYHIPRTKRQQILPQVMQLLDLYEYRNTPSEQLSRGMRQRLGLARTLLHDPPVLLLDEPASGLDPRGRREIMEILKELQAMGKTILVSSHILSELAIYCSRIGILETGQMIIQGTLQELIQKVQPNKTLKIKILQHPETCLPILRKVPDVSYAQVEGDWVMFQFAGKISDMPNIIALLTQNNIPILEIHESTPDLEEIFLHLTKGKTQ